MQSQTRGEVGEWGDPIPFGIVPVAVANLPDGRLITWSSQFRNTFIEIGDGMTYTELFDPNANGGLGQALGEKVTQTDHDMFCPGINNLADGRILSAGGTTSERTSIYDPLTGVWSRAADMNIPRGYQGNTTLSNGAVFTVGGSWSGGAGNNGGKAAELWTPESGWINLPNITGEDIYTANDLSLETQTNPLYRVDNHVWLWPAPNGKLFHAGPSEEMHWIDPDVSGGDITSAGFRADDTYSMKGTTVMFDIGKILKVGGATSYGESSTTTTPAKNNSFVIDIDVPYGSQAQVTSAGTLAESRTMHNSTVLPNGQVLVTGGLDKGAVFTDVGARYAAEIYTPGQGNDPGTWETVAEMAEARTYHSVAILMTDGRVFVGGGGLCDGTLGCEDHTNAEIYSPPYLFDTNGDLATRPSITSITGYSLGNGPYNNNPLVDYGDPLRVTTNTAVSSFSLVRFSAATHSTNNEQRRIPLATTPGTDHNLTIPDRNLLPPGYYMLFALDANGTPSISRTLRIGTAEPLQITNTNLVVDMKFDENSGSTATDASSYNNNANIVEHDDNGNIITNGGNYNWTTGIIDGAIEFNGLEHSSNALIDIPSSPSLQTLDDQITVMAWAYRNSAGSTIPDTGKVANVGLFSHDYVSTLFFGFHNTMYKWAFVTNNGPVDLYAGRAPMDTWVHMAATYDGRTAKLYANGKLISWKELSGTIPFKDDGSLQSHFTSSGFYDERSAANLPSYANGSGITDEINGKIDELKVFNKVLGETEIYEYYQQGINTGNPNVVECEEGDIIAQYRIGTGGTWLTVTPGESLIVQEGGDIYLRAETAGNQYYITTPQENGPTFDSGGSATYEYQIDTDVYQGTNPERNNGLIDIANQGQFVMTTANGCTAVFDLKVTIIDETDGCPNQLINEDGGITLPKGTSNDLEIAVGNAENTNGSDCSLRLVNVDNDSPYVKHNISLDLNTLGIVAGNEILVSLDADGTEGIPRIEVNQNNQVNTALIDHTFGSGWTNFEDTFIVPSGITTLNIWLYTNYGSNNPGTVYYDNLSVINLSQNGGNTPPVAAITAVPTNGSAPLEVNFNGSNSTDDSGIASYSWDFGDGTTATGVNVDKTFIYSGTYNVVLTITANDGGTDTEAIEIISSGAPIANIVATPQTGDTPLDVSFNASGSSGDNAIVSYAWDYGDGTMGSGITSTHTYTLVGNFTAKLTITDSAGLKDTENILITVEAPLNNAPTAVANATPLNGEAPLEVNFDGSGSTDDNGIFSYSWNFGDGTAIETDAVISHTYTNEGTYEAILTVTDAEGLIDTETIEIIVSPSTVTNSAPLAAATASPMTGTAPLLVEFDASGSTDDVAIASYSWDFGDGTTGTGINPSHTYTAVNTFTATLTVVDSEGLSDSATIEINVTQPVSGNTPPIAMMTATTMNGEAPLLVEFDASGSSDDDEIASYSWDFGDGTTGSGINPSHTYTSINTFTATLTVIDSEGLSDATTIDIIVTQPSSGNMPPIAMTTATPMNGEAPLLVEFDASGSSDDDAIASYSWDFGDGTTGTGINPSHTYTSANTFIATLTVVDSEGLTDTATIDITVTQISSGNNPPVAMITATPLNGEAPLLVEFDASASSDDNEISSYSWNFGDGSSVGTGIQTSHTFETVGVYNVVLTVIDTEGLTDTVDLEIVVTNGQPTNIAPTALATANPLNGETPLTVTFDASGSSDDNAITSYVWNYSDGTTGNGKTTTHTFSTPGIYEVILTVTDEEGLTATTNLTITVTAPNTTLNNVDLKDIKVYPNPVGNENLNINLSDFMNESIALGFYDSYGKLVFQNIVNEDHPEEIAIDVSFLSDGLYLIEITRVETNEFTYKKIIKGN
ncbi:PKD domain-containing protein [Maribacter sp. M208]|uniref:PKD domain-containing protein n=1 Tax=Maribacter huludaoensis TaxID=3030010 RepID=UPI0023EE1974|nr:PKD domain-containing protein [Maribacter huludaoensis]MDF4222870.1 PKD domain-containing protein [Maribacter huludaoensis]